MISLLARLSLGSEKRLVHVVILTQLYIDALLR